MTHEILKYLHFENPTSEQTKVLVAMEDFVSPENPDDFLILCGAAGTGKTSITAALIGYLNSLNRPYKIAAPTGRAARILGRKAKSVTSTIHSMIYTASTDKDTGKVKFKMKAEKKSDPVVYIIDEASMIPRAADKDNALFESERGLIYDLIKYIKSIHVDSKIIFLGDRYQLPPIGEIESPALNQTFLERTFNLRGSSYMLTEVKRQEDGSYILQNATDIRNAMDKGALNHPIEGTRNNNIYAAADKYVRELKVEGLENQVAISVSHKANQFFNALVRDRIFGKAKKMLEPGDLLMVTQNWRRSEMKLYNGDHVELLEVDWKVMEEVAGLHFTAVKLKLLFSPVEHIVEDYVLLESVPALGGILDSIKENNLRRARFIKNQRYRQSELPEDDRYVGAIRMTYGHAITCNKAQGGEWKKIFINTMGIPSLKWQYTAVTRGIDAIEKF